MTMKPQLAGDADARAGANDHGLGAEPVALFVINLCSSTTPMALTQPDAPELKRFRFFVSRRLEDRRERFRLHMGYFASLEEAEEWLSVVRDVYPGAWAGEAPGKRLRARAAAVSLPGAPPASAHTPPQELAASFAAPPITLPPASSASMIVARTDVVASVAASPAPLPAPAPSTIEPPASVAALAAPAATRVPVTHKPQQLVVAAPKASAPAPLQEAAKKSAEIAANVAASATPPAALAPLSHVREVLAALDATEAKAAVPPPSVARRTQALSDTQVMKILEERRSQQHARGATEETGSNIPMLRPDDSDTLRALREAVQNNAAVSFALQLQWSVQPMALDKVPPLAIFSAYTLYTVEGSRDGRKWYGLRLGFFADADAAKQVAHYVRSEFTTVAVLPVSVQEHRRATQANQQSELASFKEASSRAADAPEIELLNEARGEQERRSAASPMRGAAKLATGGAHAAAPAARAAAQRSKKLRSKERAAERKAPYSLEETLEILGAGDLQIDNGSGELINQRSVRHLKVEVRKDSPFARLVARLTERVRKS